MLYNSNVPAKEDNSAADDDQTYSQTNESNSNHRSHCNSHR